MWKISSQKIRRLTFNSNLNAPIYVILKFSIFLHSSNLNLNKKKKIPSSMKTLDKDPFYFQINFLTIIQTLNFKVKIKSVTKLIEMQWKWGNNKTHLQCIQFRGKIIFQRRIEQRGQSKYAPLNVKYFECDINLILNFFCKNS